MEKISFICTNTPSSEIITKVYLGGRIVGKIKEVKGGFQYFPNKSKFGGDVFPTLKDCKNSLIG